MRRKFIRILWSTFGGIIGIAFLGILFVEWGWIGNMPDFDELQNPISKYASQVFSADGALMGTWSRSENRVFVAQEEISEHVFHALVATEDARFYDHCGIDGRALGRAIVKRGMLGQKNAGGGSTITQQLAKQLYSTTASSSIQRLLQKPIEWVIAVELERHYTKDEIITLYLNYFDFLHNAVGIKTAAKVYFGKSPKKLTVPEAALLIGMCKNPSYYNPVREGDRCLQRRNVVLQQMAKYGYLTAAEAEQYSRQPLGLHYHRVDHKEGTCTYLREYLRRILMAERPDRSTYASWQEQQYYADSLAWETDPLYGWCNKNTKHDGSHYDIYTDGLKIYTTIDTAMQRYAEQAVYAHVAKYLQPAFEREKAGSATFPYSKNLSSSEVKQILDRAMRQSERYRQLKAAGASEEEIRHNFATKTPMSVFTYRGEVDTLMSPMDSIRYYKKFLRAGMMSLDPATGAVKAYVGGLNYQYFQYDMCMVGRRQVGSTMKPFVYALAMQDGMTPDDRAYCGPRTYTVAGQAWSPRNTSHARQGSMVPLRWGLAQSNNWVTADLMNTIDATGVRLVELLHNFGVANPSIYPSIALCLGSCDITVAEMASAYTAFVNRGIRCAPLLVSRIEDADGRILAEFTTRTNEVLSEESAYYMIDMMRGVIDHGTGSRMRSMYGFTAPIAGKTGTSNNHSDAWFVGYVPRLVTACWVGGEDRDIHFNSMAYGQGSAAALPIWAYYMTKVYRDPRHLYNQEEEFDIPEEMKPKRRSDGTSGGGQDAHASENYEAEDLFD